MRALRTISSASMRRVSIASPPTMVSKTFRPQYVRYFAAGDLTTMKVPSMGDSITEGTIVEWVKKPNEFVAKDDVVVVVETDKVSVDIRATVSGTIVETKAQGKRF